MRILATLVWILAASLAIGFGVIHADPPQPKTSIWIEWQGQGIDHCPTMKVCS
jgi:hypothetical protein